MCQIIVSINSGNCIVKTIAKVVYQIFEDNYRYLRFNNSAITKKKCLFN